MLRAETPLVGGEESVMRAFVTIAAALSLSGAPAVAQAANASCFTEREFEDVLMVLAPAALRLMGEQCSPVLRSGAVLGNPDSAFAKSVEAASREAWPGARSTILRVMKSEGETLNPGDLTMTREAFSAGIAPMFGKIITKLDSCPSVDKMLKLVEPVPLRSLAGIFVQILRIAPKERIPVLCPAAP